MSVACKLRKFISVLISNFYHISSLEINVYTNMWWLMSLKVLCFSKMAVQTIQESGKLCILDVEINGVKSIKKAGMKPEPRFIFVKPPSIESLVWEQVYCLLFYWYGASQGWWGSPAKGDKKEKFIQLQHYTSSQIWSNVHAANPNPTRSC